MSISGRVESILNGTLVVTVEGAGYDAGQSVAVAREDGTSLGQGSLYIHSAWKATAYTGIVSAVHAQAEKEISSGGSLFTLKDTDFPAEKHKNLAPAFPAWFAMREKLRIDCCLNYKKRLKEPFFVIAHLRCANKSLLATYSADIK